MRVGINLLWLKPKKMGGVEQFAKNLISGFSQLKTADDIEFIVFVNRKSIKYLKQWDGLDKFLVVDVNVDPFNVIEVLTYQYIFFGRLASRYNLDILYHPTPIYPLRRIKSVKQVVTFHDLLFRHYPEYATCLQRIKYSLSWYYSLKNADLVVAISNFTKNDILSQFDVDEEKIKVIYDPIIVPNRDWFYLDHSQYLRRLDLNPGEYFYTVSSLLPHKNTEVLLKLLKKIIEEKVDLPTKLVITGVRDLKESDLWRFIKKEGLENNVISTGFVSDDEKFVLMKHCYCFLFPSVFEGFGMPPVEASAVGAIIVASNIEAIVEVTNGYNKILFVNNPLDEMEWLNQILKAKSMRVYDNQDSSYNNLLINKYSPENVGNQYIQVFLELTST
ncbi:glycosyltransferase family 4 protein [Fervidobacterium thailandense]|uniref:Glycosyltransferase family 1 protein n=1 Tax=Fervidobacterium thailandense TaxID=1008305 RepID=A0A1E3G3W9_9BACT|nr:glycosyltransferase family 1 protein [Fervidobacterium thailandense]ODN30971.1 hypothetical protein A4H02_01460 [Fervidobacterium thailandense]